jgi:hypothetical protein
MSQWNFRQPSLIPQIDEVPNPASDHQQAEDCNQPSENSRAHIEPPLSMRMIASHHLECNRKLVYKSLPASWSALFEAAAGFAAADCRWHTGECAGMARGSEDIGVCHLARSDFVAGRLFACRYCYRLAYASQQESAHQQDPNAAGRKPEHA